MGLALILGACSNPAPAGSGISSASGKVSDQAQSGQSADNIRTITHDLGSTDVPAEPQRVVVLEQGFTQTIAALDVKPVGVADDNKPERFPKDTLDYIKGYTSVGTRSEPNLEVIRTLKPDLIIADTSRHAGIYEQLSAIAPTIVFKNDTANYEQTLAATKAIGTALGKTEATDELISNHEAQVEKLKQEIDPDQSVLIIAPDEETSNAFQIRTTAAFHSSFLQTVGLDYALSDETEVSQVMTLEQLMMIDPDVLLILINEDNDSVIEAQQANPLWMSLKSVQNGNVHEVELATWSRQRSIPALDQIMGDVAEYF